MKRLFSGAAKFSIRWDPRCSKSTISSKAGEWEGCGHWDVTLTVPPAPTSNPQPSPKEDKNESEGTSGQTGRYQTVGVSPLCEGISEIAVGANWRLPKVVIVGAGVAGLSAAHRLMKAGIKDITILEACNKAGGRVMSCQMEDCVVELGSPLINGMSLGNSLVTLSAMEKVPIFRRTPFQGIFLDYENDVVPERLVRIAARIYERVHRRAKDVYRCPRPCEVGSLRAFFDKELKEELGRVKPFEVEQVRSVVLSMLGDVESAWGADANCIGVSRYGSQADLVGGDALIPNGLSRLLGPLAKSLPKCLKAASPVMAIKWGPGGVLVKCCDGSEYPGDFCICTVSLGVLKAYHPKFFCPPLPRYKQEAIHALGYGFVLRVLLHFEKPFWVGGEGPVRWPGGRLEAADNHTFVATMIGDEAIKAECMTDCCLQSYVLCILRKALDDTSLPLPKVWTKSEWNLSRYFQGAVSYMSEESTVGHQLQLARPEGGVAPSLLFAGEATSPAHYGTVHGARETGLREADRIINIVRLHYGKPPRPCFVL